MTTNVFDGAAGVVASDSRWSIRFGRWLTYVDDTNFDKIEIYGDTVFMFAGKGRLIQEWKNWIRSGPKDASGMPACDGMCVCAMDVPSKTVKLSEGQSIRREGAVFAGSGASHACLCWVANRDARRSVDTAKQLDPATGGTVKYLDFATRQHNLGSHLLAPMTIDEVDKAVMEKGIIMDLGTMKTGAPFKLSELAANEGGEFRELQEKIANGELSAEAPCDAMYSEWTDEAKGRLKTFLGGVFGWK